MLPRCRAGLIVVAAMTAAAGTYWYCLHFGCSHLPTRPTQSLLQAHAAKVFAAEPKYQRQRSSLPEGWAGPNPADQQGQGWAGSPPDLVLVAVHQRPAMLMRTLQLLLRAAGGVEQLYVFFVDTGADPRTESVLQAFAATPSLKHRPVVVHSLPHWPDGLSGENNHSRRDHTKSWPRPVVLRGNSFN
eukprot:SAG31_NODE_14616_length_796_cov_1.175036_2_plen_186_part_01